MAPSVFDRDLDNPPTADQVALESLQRYWSIMDQGQRDRIALLSRQVQEMGDELNSKDRELARKDAHILQLERELMRSGQAHLDAMASLRSLQEATGGSEAVALLRSDLERCRSECEHLQGRVFDLRVEVQELRGLPVPTEQLAPPVFADEENSVAAMSEAPDSARASWEPESELGIPTDPPNQVGTQPDASSPPPPTSPHDAPPAEPERFDIHGASDPEVDVASEEWPEEIPQATATGDPPSSPTSPQESSGEDL